MSIIVTDTFRYRIEVEDDAVVVSNAANSMRAWTGHLQRERLFTKHNEDTDEMLVNNKGYKYWMDNFSRYEWHDMIVNNNHVFVNNLLQATKVKLSIYCVGTYYDVCLINVYVPMFRKRSNKMNGWSRDIRNGRMYIK